jgi:hypothetical protein
MRRARSRLVPSKVRARKFTEIYRAGGWRGDQPTLSGHGSNLEWTARVRAQLPELLKEIGIASLLDAPCGDFFWMKECNLQIISYVGMDIVSGLIEENSRRYGRTGRSFKVGDLVTDDLPRVDLIFCRDCLVHLRNREVIDAIRNFKRSGSTYLLTTTFTNVGDNTDLDQPGDWRAINLTQKPFYLPQPLRVLDEGYAETGGRFTDKALGLWRLSDLDV